MQLTCGSIFDLVPVKRVTMRYEPEPDPVNELISAQLQEIAEKRLRFGAPRLHVMLRREDLKINHKSTERISQSLGLSLHKKRKKERFRREKRGILPPPTRRNQYWAMDFVSDQLVNGGRF